jgi:hypothetical protein
MLNFLTFSEHRQIPRVNIPKLRKGSISEPAKYPEKQTDSNDKADKAVSRCREGHYLHFLDPSTRPRSKKSRDSGLRIVCHGG